MDFPGGAMAKNPSTKAGGFPGSSAGKESVCNAGDSSLIPGLERFLGVVGFQYSWASLMAQMVKNLSAMCETWV